MLYKIAQGSRGTLDNPMCRHEHDCSDCLFVGSLMSMDRRIDVYLHGNMTDGTVIARTSSEGADYASAPIGILPAYESGDLFHAYHLVLAVVAP